MQFTEIKSLKRIHKVNEGIGTDDILKTPGIVHPTTGEKLTVGEAISLRVLDVRSGSIVTGDGTVISINDAVSAGLIDAKLADSLSGPFGVTEDGRSISLLEAIQREIYDAEHQDVDSLESRIKVVQDSGTSIASAIDKGKVDTERGEYVLDSGARITLSEAYDQGYLVETEVRIKTSAVCLYDALVQGLIDETTGWIVDRNSGNKFQIDTAIKHGLVDRNVREVVDPKTDNKVTLIEAIERGIINPKLGRYVNVHEKLPFAEAKRRQLIVKPMTLKDVCDKNLYDEDGNILSPLRVSKLNILESISRGILDCDSIRCITDTKTDQLLTLSESLRSGIILPSGHFKDALTGEVCTIPVAVERGFITSVAQKSIFDIEGFKAPDSGEYVSFNTVYAQGLVSKKHGGSLVTDLKTGQLVPLRQAAENNSFVKPQVFNMLDRGIGIFENDDELTVLEAVFSGHINPRNGNVINPKTQKPVPINEAIKLSIITPEGAALLNSLLSISITSQTISKIVKRYCTVTHADVTRKEMKMTFVEAVKKGLIDEQSQTFIDPDTNEVISIQDALNSGVIGATPTDDVEISKFYKTDMVVPISEPKPTHERRSTEKQVFELPPEGWTLSEAISHGHFDPVTGLFIIPGTDRLVSFEECIKLQIINPSSASVVDPSNSRKISLLRSLEKHILNSTGHYKTPAKLVTMKEAIENHHIVLESMTETEQTNQRLIQITKVTGKPDLVEVSNVLDKNPPTFTKVKSTDSETSNLEPLLVSPGVIYDPSTALIIFTESGKSKNILEAVKEKELQPQLVNVKDPYTGKEMPLNEAINKGIVDGESGDYKDKSGRRISLSDAAKYGVLSIIGEPLVAAAGVVSVIRNAMVKDPQTGEEIPMEVAYERGLVDDDAYKKYEAQASASIEPEGTPEKVITLSAASIDLDDDDLPTAGELTRGRVTTEPKYKVSIGRARSFSQSPEREAKPVILQKMRKKIIKPSDALERGMIDEATAKILGKEENFKSSYGESLNLSEAISKKKLDGNKGAIVDPERGDVLTINEAITRGILDPNGTNQLLVPLNRSLSVPQLVDQGLLDPNDCKVVHPETGTHLSLHEAIVCNIVDPLSKLTNEKDEEVTLEQAIVKGDVDDDRSTVKTKEGEIDLLTAVEKNVFDETPRTSDIPPAGMTFAVALKRGLIDTETQQITHPITGERTPIETAIKEYFIMALPCPVTSESVDIESALSQKLIDSEKGTFTHPKTGELIPINEAIETGLLVVKQISGLVPAGSSQTTTTVTKTYHTITTKTIELLPGYVLVSTKEIKNMNTGEVVSMDEARKRKIVIGEIEVKENFTTMSFSDAIKQGLVDFEAGTYTNPETGTTIPISSALQEGILDDAEPEANREISETDGKVTQLSLMEAYENIYDEKSKLFKDPKDPNQLITFTQALERNIIDPNSIVYDACENKQVSVKDAVQTGLIDSKSGEVKHKLSGMAVNVKDAAKMGLLAIIGAPILAGVKAVEAVKELSARIGSKPESDVGKTIAPIEASQAAPVAQKVPVEEVPEVERPRMPLEQAIRERLIEPIICRIIDGDKEWPYTVQDSLQNGHIKPETIVDVVSRSQISIVDDLTQLPLIITRHFKPEELAAIGCFDLRTNKFVNPHTGDEISFQHFIYSLDIFDPDNILVKDLNSNPAIFISLRDALERPIIDKNSGYMVDPKTGKRVSFFDAIKLGWIIERTGKPAQLLTLDDAIKSNLLDIQTGRINNPSGETVEFHEAIRDEIIDPNSVTIRNLESNELVPMTDAIENGSIDLNKAVIVSLKTNHHVPLASGFIQGYIFPASRKPVSLEAIVRKGYYVPSTGQIIDPFTKLPIVLDESIKRSIVDVEITKCKDTESNEIVQLDRAISTHLVDPIAGQLRDRKLGKSVTFDVAIQRGLITTQRIKYTLIEIIMKEYYCSRTGRILNPITGEEDTLKDAIENGIVEVNTTTIKDEDRGKVVTFREARDSGLVDVVKGTLTHPVIPLDEAVRKGYVMSTIKPWSLQEALAQGCYDPKTGLLLIDDVKMTVKEAMQKCLINPDCLTVKYAKTGQMVSLSEAIKEGILDPKTGMIADPSTGTEMNLYDALDRGLIIPSKRKFSLPEAVFKEFYEPQSGKFITPQCKEKVPTDWAIRKGFIDPQSTLVNVGGVVTTFEKAVDDGIIDTKRGLVKLPNRKLDFREAFEQGLFIEARKPLSLSEAIVKGIFDPQTCLFLDPQTGEYLTLKEAIANKVIDPNSVNVKDTRSGIWSQISLTDAIRLGYVDGESAQVKDYTQGENYSVGLNEAFNIGLISDSSAPISLQRAIHQGIYDDKTGKFMDPKSGMKITLHEMIRRFVINPLLPCYWDEKSERLLNLNETCRLDVVDRRSGMFRPNGEEPISLSEALERGCIVDIETMGFGLYESIGMGLYDPITCQFANPSTNQKSTLNNAIQIDMINPMRSLVKHVKSGKYLNLNDAICQSVIDDVAGVYNLPNGNRCNLIEARNKGLIVTVKKMLSVEEAIKNCLYRPDTGKFVDASTGEYFDLALAINVGLIDPLTTVLRDPNTNKTKSLIAAIEQGDIDVAKGRVLDAKLKRVYNLDKALEKGLLVTVDRSKSNQEDVTKVQLKDLKILRECTIEEAIKFELIDPETALVKDPASGKFKPLKEAIEREIVDVNKKAHFELQTGKIRPRCVTVDQNQLIYLAEPMSFEQALQGQHLDSATGKFTDPQTKEVITLKEAVTLGVIDPDTVLVKDGNKKKFIKLPEAFRRGLMDSEKGNVLDSTSSKLHSLSSAIDSGLLLTPSRGITLIETIIFGLYNPTTGGVTNPFLTASIIDRKRLTLTDCIDCGLIDPTATVVKDPENGSIVTLTNAIETGLIDSVAGRLNDKCSDKPVDLLRAYEKGLIVPAEARVSFFDSMRILTLLLITPLLLIAPGGRFHAVARSM